MVILGVGLSKKQLNLIDVNWLFQWQLIPKHPISPAPPAP